MTELATLARRWVPPSSAQRTYAPAKTIVHAAMKQVRINLHRGAFSFQQQGRGWIAERTGNSTPGSPRYSSECPR